jgi:hypothetical protein
VFINGTSASLLPLPYPILPLNYQGRDISFINLLEIPIVQVFFCKFHQVILKVS